MRALGKLCRPVGRGSGSWQPRSSRQSRTCCRGRARASRETIRRMIDAYRPAAMIDGSSRGATSTQPARSSASGSVGTRAGSCSCSDGTTMTFFLQFKEAEASVLEPFLGKCVCPAWTAGRRRATNDAGGARHHAQLGEDRRDRRRTKDFHSPVMGREGSAEIELLAPRAGYLRCDLRLDACASSRALGRRDRDAAYLGSGEQVRPRDGGIRWRTRPEQTIPGAAGSGRVAVLPSSQAFDRAGVAVVPEGLTASAVRFP